MKVTYRTGTDQSPEASWTGTTDALSTTQAITTTATDYTFQDIYDPVLGDAGKDFGGVHPGQDGVHE